MTRQAIDNGPSRSTWLPMDLAAIVAGIEAGEIVGTVPELMPRSDGVALLYPGEVHSLAGEPESGKGWILAGESARLINAGDQVLYLDFEDSAARIVGRLLALAARPAAILEHFAYARPCDPIKAAALDELYRDRTDRLAVIDGVTNAYSLLGLDADSNADAARFLAIVARPLAERGAAVVLVDHVTKSRETRGRFPIGAQHKLAGVAAAFSVEVVTAPSRQTAGLVKLAVSKDRHGYVRGHAQAGVVALVRITPADDGARVTVTLDPPDATTTEGTFRPTFLMERISQLVERTPGIVTRAIRDGVKGKTSAKDAGLALLIAERYIDRRPDGSARRHFTLRPFVEDTDDEAPCPDRDPAPCPTVPHRDPAVTDACPEPRPATVPPTPLLRSGGERGTVTPEDADAELAHIAAKFPDLTANPNGDTP
jgi:hypothetical protein